MNPVHRAYIDIATAMIIVGSSIVVGKIITNSLPIFAALFIRFSIAIPLLIWLCQRRGVLYVPKKSLLVQIFLQALFGVFLFNALLLMGLRFTTASQGAILSSATPAFIALLGWFILKERISISSWVGVLLTVLGILIINLVGAESVFQLDGSALLGNALMLAAFFCEALFIFFRKTSAQIPALLGATWVTVFGMLLSLPLGVYEMLQFDVATISWMDVAVLLYYGIFVSAIAYFLAFRGLERASATAAGVLSGLVPISAIIISTLILGEAFTLAHAVGLLLVSSAIVIMTRQAEVVSNSQVKVDNRTIHKFETE